MPIIFIPSPMTLPQPSGEFEWVQASWGPALRCRAIQAPHVFTTRSLELRQNEDGWRQLAAELGVDAGHIFRPKQVHGDAVIVVPCASVASGLSRTPPIFDPCASAADIIMTRNADVAVAVQAADCVPLLFFDPVTGAVAAAHAGWRGTAAGVARSATRAMADHFGTRAENLIVAIGPSIGPCCYQVGEELLGAFGPEGRRWFYQSGRRLDAEPVERESRSAGGGRCEERQRARGGALHRDASRSFRFIPARRQRAPDGLPPPSRAVFSSGRSLRRVPLAWVGRTVWEGGGYAGRIPTSMTSDPPSGCFPR